MQWMRDEYEKIVGEDSPAVVTGKPVEAGGSEGRSEATGLGGFYALSEIMKLTGRKSRSASVAIQGFGNVGSISAQLLEEQGCKVIAVSDISGAYYNKKGIAVHGAIAYAQKHKSLEGWKGGEKITQVELLTLECDVLVPAAKEDQITASAAKKVRAKIIVEGANGPTTAAADPILQEKGVFVIPDILANSGGVTVSYFEWVQDRMGYFWDLARVNRRLDRMMKSAFDAVYETARKHNVTMRIGAYVLAIDKVANTLKVRGIYA
jgi:glutamate dehydrogenase (NAD(P)+)